MVNFASASDFLLSFNILYILEGTGIVRERSEMANQGAEKRKEENSRRLKNLLRFIIFCNVFYLVVRAGIFHSTFKWKHWFGFMLTFFAYVIPYQQLAMIAKPRYSESGELEHGGFDLTADGLCGYLRDLLYITGFVQLTTIISDKFWYIYLLTPLFPAYKLRGFAEDFMSLVSKIPEEDKKSRKKIKKMWKASRPKFARTRN
ncbi:Transmembrane protein 208 [Camellia lanceoleosa]|uniref:Transmembrane protein 208 n=1 Tax=Camellia lanceoleosa TaxID=1840588 RepID=A0ACC0I0R8_9ERIC|nr:Transmembrane protein 208 [Camellia lanceoleosa]